MKILLALEISGRFLLRTNLVENSDLSIPVWDCYGLIKLTVLFSSFYFLFYESFWGKGMLKVLKIFDQLQDYSPQNLCCYSLTHSSYWLRHQNKHQSLNDGNSGRFRRTCPPIFCWANNEHSSFWSYLSVFCIVQRWVNFYEYVNWTCQIPFGRNLTCSLACALVFTEELNTTFLWAVGSVPSKKSDWPLNTNEYWSTIKWNKFFWKNLASFNEAWIKLKFSYYSD